MIRTIPTAADRKNSVALESGRLLKSGSGQLISLIGHNGGPLQYIQLFDSAGTPANGAVPIIMLKVGADGTFGIDTPIKFTTGLYVGNSSTLATRTAGAADCWFLAQVL